MTDASLRPLHLDNMEILFKTAAPSRLYWAGQPAMHVVQALYWMYDVLPSTRDDVIARLKDLLCHPAHGQAIRDDLKAGLHTLPSWMQSIVHETLSTSEGRPKRDRIRDG